MTFRERYQFNPKKDFIGKGGFARVYRAYDTIRKRTVALKFYHGIESEKYDIIGEINRMEDVVHPNVIRWYDATYIENTNAIGENERLQVGIMEYANHGDISTFFKEQRKPETYRAIILGILQGLQYLHMNDIAHRDLKPKNILLHKVGNDIIAKIADFGISKRMGIDAADSDASSQLLGSVEYMAPEQFAPAVYGIKGQLDTNVDLWSFGVILYELFANELPFGSRNTGLTYERILNNILFEDMRVDFQHIPQPYQAIVERCLHKKANERCRQAEELIDILNGKKPSISSIINQDKDNGATQTLDQQFVKNAQQKAFDNSKENIETEWLNKPSESKDPKESSTFSDSLNTAILYPKKEALTKATNTQKPNLKERINTPKPSVEPYTPKKSPIAQTPKGINREIGVGKDLFKIGDFKASFNILDRYAETPEFNEDTEAVFYLGYMYYNGNCGGAHNVDKGRSLMLKAKSRNRPLIQELMLKHILNK